MSECARLLARDIGNRITFLIGLYSGIYISQNYQVPILPGPIGLWDKVKESSKQFEKKDKD